MIGKLDIGGRLWDWQKPAQLLKYPFEADVRMHHHQKIDPRPEQLAHYHDHKGSRSRSISLFEQFETDITKARYFLAQDINAQRDHRRFRRVARKFPPTRIANDSKIFRRSMAGRNSRAKIGQVPLATRRKVRCFVMGVTKHKENPRQDASVPNTTLPKHILDCLHFKMTGSLIERRYQFPL